MSVARPVERRAEQKGLVREQFVRRLVHARYLEQRDRVRTLGGIARDRPE
jgi:hypothetical protein